MRPAGLPMAAANGAPVVDVAVGAAALDRDLSKVMAPKGVTSPKELGWSRPNRLTLLVMLSKSVEIATETFMLKLGFQAYPRWPPSAQFVNPKTLEYRYPEDQPHVPKLTSPECHTHVAYQGPAGQKIQLICCSATLEFYEVAHGVDPKHIWQNSDSFLTTVNAIQRALSTHYQGRFTDGQ